MFAMLIYFCVHPCLLVQLLCKFNVTLMIIHAQSCLLGYTTLIAHSTWRKQGNEDLYVCPIGSYYVYDFE